VSRRDNRPVVVWDGRDLRDRSLGSLKLRLLLRLMSLLGLNSALNCAGNGPALRVDTGGGRLGGLSGFRRGVAGDR